MIIEKKIQFNKTNNNNIMFKYENYYGNFKNNMFNKTIAITNNNNIMFSYEKTFVVLTKLLINYTEFDLFEN